MSAFIDVVASNICCNPKRSQTHVNTRIGQAARLGNVNFGSEVEIPRYWDAWRSIMAEHGKHSYGIGHEVPISVSSEDFHVISSRVVYIHRGYEGITPHRDYCEVLTEYRDGSKKKPIKVAFIAEHPVSEGHEADRHKADHWPLRHALLVEYQKKVAARIKYLRAHGYTVVWGGDMNDPNTPKVFSGQVALVSAGLDHLWVMPAADVKIASHEARYHVAPSEALGMDHPIIGAHIVVTRRNPVVAAVKKAALAPTLLRRG